MNNEKELIKKLEDNNILVQKSENPMFPGFFFSYAFPSIGKRSEFYLCHEEIDPDLVDELIKRYKQFSFEIGYSLKKRIR